MVRLPTLLVVFLGGLLFALVGCTSQGITVTGKVTVNGQPLPKGQIAFYPVPDGGTPVAAPVVQGKYTSPPLPPGDRKVVIAEELDFEIVTSSEELQRLAAEGRPPPPAPVSRIQEQTKGNGRQVTISTSTENLDFELTVD